MARALKPRLEQPPMTSPSFLPKQSTVLLVLLTILFCLTGCSTRLVKETEAKSAPRAPAKPTTLPEWLGNPARNFYGTGPWSGKKLEVVWQFETQWIKGRLHEDPWGGSSWPGQPSIDTKQVYFGSADGNLYALNRETGKLVWSFKTGDSLKATPTIAGDRIIASGLDYYVYCLNARDGSLIWKFKTGFEVDCSAAVIDGRIY